jgi:hypothetical protein
MIKLSEQTVLEVVVQLRRARVFGVAIIAGDRRSADNSR